MTGAGSKRLGVRCSSSDNASIGIRQVDPDLWIRIGIGVIDYIDGHQHVRRLRRDMRVPHEQAAPGRLVREADVPDVQRVGDFQPDAAVQT